jgi:hypothetical protein
MLHASQFMYWLSLSVTGRFSQVSNYRRMQENPPKCKYGSRISEQFSGVQAALGKLFTAIRGLLKRDTDGNLKI